MYDKKYLLGKLIQTIKSNEWKFPLVLDFSSIFILIELIFLGLIDLLSIIILNWIHIAKKKDEIA